MKICIFGAASEHIDNSYIIKVESLCKKLAERGHSLVFGAGATGLMGASARGFKAGGGKIYGVIPRFFKEASVEIIYNNCDELIFTDTMAERKAKMEDFADAFLIVPGGIGTFEEMFQVMTLKQLGRHEKAIIIYNLNEYYNDLESFLKKVVERKFITCACSEIYEIVDTEDKVINSLENYVSKGTPWQKLKIGE